jgi:hypothetical protein
VSDAASEAGEPGRVERSPGPRFADDTIVFFCANGHRIVVAARHAGKRGRCDRAGCGAAVTVPVPPRDGGAGSSAPPSLEEDGFVLGGAALEDASARVGGEEVRLSTPGTPREAGVPKVLQDGLGPQEGHPTARLVERLWEEREHGGVFEVHVAGGGVILPEWYEPHWSQGTHGLFASQAADGSVTLTAVAWDAIQKIVVRQVKGLPDGMFE